MSSLAEANGGARRRSPLVWIALALSLTLNVCFVGGLVWSKFIMERVETPAAHIKRLGDALNLTGTQTADYRNFVRTLRQRTRLLQESNAPLLDRIWQEQAKPTPDAALVSHLVGEAAENRESYQKDTSAALAAFLAKLTPEQRADLAAFAGTRHDPLSRRIWWLVVP